MTAADIRIDLTSDFELAVNADLLDDEGRADDALMVRRIIGEMQALRAALADLAENGKVRPKGARLIVRGYNAEKLVLFDFRPLPGHSGRRSHGTVMRHDAPTGQALAHHFHSAIAAPALCDLARRSRQEGTKNKACHLIHARVFPESGCAVDTFRDEAGTVRQYELRAD